MGGERAARTNGVLSGARLTCALVALLGCGDEPERSEQQLVSEATPTVLPALGCYAALPRAPSCMRDADCPDGQRCVLDALDAWSDLAPAPLHCDHARGTREAHVHCRASGDCQSGICSLANRCVEPCRESADCADDHACRPVQARLADGLGPVMACVRALALPGDVQVAVVRDAPSLRHGKTALDVPGLDDPALIYVQASCEESGVEVQSLYANALLRDVFDDDVKAPADNTVLHDGSALVSFMYPNNPSLEPARDGLTIEVRAKARQHADLVVASRSAGMGVLDLHVFYVGGGTDVGDDPTGFHPGASSVAKMLRRLDVRLRELGLSLGEVEEHDVPGTLREELAVLDVPHHKVGDRDVEGRPLRVDELFALSAGVETVGVDLFLVRDMSSYVGIAGGIPGVLGLHGTSRSGVAIAVDTMGDLDGADLVLLHELAHFLGLFHTTESSGNVLDPLSDTPTCDLGQDADHDGELSSEECAEHGADNLMFWTGAGAVVTPQQRAVLQSAVILR